MEEKPKIELKPEPKVVNKPTGQLRGSTLSIKKMLSPEHAVENTVDISNLPFESYGIDDIKMEWRRYAHEIRAKGKETFFGALIKRDPVVREDHLYILEVDNSAQVDYILPLLPDFITSLRRKVKNYAVNVLVEISKNAGEESKFLTGKDKFNKLARKNPNLHTLKTSFDLDIEY